MSWLSGIEDFFEGKRSILGFGTLLKSPIIIILYLVFWVREII
jgi:hypothetical protein